ncbi:MAG: ABC transporter permease subunit, partial [Thermoplasmata archaeon]
MARNPLRPIYVVSKKEFKTNLLSIRMVVLLSILALVVVGGSYGLAGQQIGPEQLVPWVHPIVGDDPTGITVFVSDAWGVPHVGLEVQLSRQNPAGQSVLLDTGQTDGDGFVKFLSLPEGDYRISASLGSFSRIRGISLRSFLDYGNLSFVTELFDLDNSGLVDDFAMHFMDTSGEVPSGVTVLLDETEVGPPDSRGYLLVKLREGTNNLTIVYKGETSGLIVSTRPNPGGISPFAEGSDIVLFIIAITFGSLLLPIVAIALSYDSIAKEKAEGSADLLLYRPASWRAVAMGKFLGVFSAIALPVTAVILTGVLIITAVTGTWPSFTATSGFIAFSLFLLAVYILLMQSLSTMAKTAGTAILFGI